MLLNSTIQHLRLGFSLFLMPVYWFAMGQATHIHIMHAILIFFILHFLVYPSSNGYNSYMDRDTGSIGGVEKPLPVHQQLLHVCNVMDILAVLLSFLISASIAAGIAIYIIASRLYSHRGIRLKKYPVISYLTVAICQGALVYFIVSFAINQSIDMNRILTPAIISSLLIGGTYPLTQVYQHMQDKNDGVISLSYVLGIRGTFIFCTIVLSTALLLLGIYFVSTDQLYSLLFYFVSMIPVVIYFARWLSEVNINEDQANFRNTMKMNYVASVCNNVAFLVIFLIRGRMITSDNGLHLLFI